MEQTGKQGKDDNNIGSIITMLITDQVTFRHIFAKMHFALESEKVQTLFGGIQNFKLA